VGALACGDKVQLRLRNDTVAEIVRRYPDRLVGFASVDPHKGDRAIAEAERAVRDLGLSGMKFHPGVQAFSPNDRRFYPLFERIASLGVSALFHTGTNGLGAGMAGGGASSSTTSGRSIWIAWPPTSRRSRSSARTPPGPGSRK
jgi:predicted TIM-barrel fold metal-dependent hydrolase